MPPPSPTTTSALKLRFLPPLTTIVTRLICTTVSFRSSWLASIFSRLPIALFIESLRRSPLRALELQPRFARRVGDRAHPAVIQIAAAVEDHLRDTLRLRALGDRPADHLRAGDVAAARVRTERALERRLGRRGRRDGRAREVVDDLRVGVRHAAEHRQARPLGRPAQLLALPQMNARALIFLRLDSHESPTLDSPTGQRTPLGARLARLLLQH